MLLTCGAMGVGSRLKLMTMAFLLAFISSGIF